jgi:hypothetical protein
LTADDETSRGAGAQGVDGSAPGEGATRVTLTQLNLTGGIRDSDIKMRAQFEKTWTAVLDGLEKAVSH